MDKSYMGGKMTRTLKSGKADMPAKDPTKKTKVRSITGNKPNTPANITKPKVSSIERGIRRALGM